MTGEILRTNQEFYGAVVMVHESNRCTPGWIMIRSGGTISWFPARGKSLCWSVRSRSRCLPQMHMPKILVIAEHDEGHLKLATLSAVSFASKLATEAGGTFEVL